MCTECAGADKVLIKKEEMKTELKSVHVHFAPGSKGRSFPLEYS